MIKHIVAITLVSFICCFQQHVDSRILKNIPPIRDHRQILAHAKMHSRNRRNDPSFKVEYHHGKDEHGNILQKPKIKKDPRHTVSLMKEKRTLRVLAALARI